MSDYIERIRQAVYRSPGGDEFVLQFDDVERSGGKKAAVHEFPQQDKASVQDLGNQAEKFPMSVYFTGADYDQQADAFWAALSERGTGFLQHPRYGDIPVLPLTWSQTEKLVDGLGRADFKVDFIQVRTDTVFPVTSVAAAAAVDAATSAAIEQSAGDAADAFAPANAADKAGVKSQVTNWLNEFKAAFKTVTAISESVQAEINKAVSAITTGLDDLIEAPLELFNSLANLAAMPAKIVTNVVNKVDAYREQIVAVAQSIPATYTQAVTVCEGIFYAFGGASAASTVGDIRTRGDAISAADTMDDIRVTVEQAIEAIEDAVPGFRAGPEVMGALIEAAATARASLLDRAYSLKAERRLTLASERTALDLIAELYPDGVADLDAALDEFISTNDLQGDEVLLVPAGREVVYYA